MATLKERNTCHVCGELATYASWSEADGTIFNVNWFCEPRHEYILEMEDQRRIHVQTPFRIRREIDGLVPGALLISKGMTNFRYGEI
jgi:hypothetical protein